MHQEFGDRIAYAKPQGGYFFWVRLPETVDAGAYLAQAAAHKVGYRPGARFSSQGALQQLSAAEFCVLWGGGVGGRGQAAPRGVLGE